MCYMCEARKDPRWVDEIQTCIKLFQEACILLNLNNEQIHFLADVFKKGIKTPEESKRHVH